MEAIGDITTSAEVSRQPVEGEVFDSRIQGGLLADGLGGFFSALFTVTPLSVFAQVVPLLHHHAMRLTSSLGRRTMVSSQSLAVQT